jgi:hypothetical protein
MEEGEKGKEIFHWKTEDEPSELGVLAVSLPIPQLPLCY